MGGCPEIPGCGGDACASEGRQEEASLSPKGRAATKRRWAALGKGKEQSGTDRSLTFTTTKRRRDFLCQLRNQYVCFSPGFFFQCMTSAEPSGVQPLFGAGARMIGVVGNCVHGAPKCSFRGN